MMSKRLHRKQIVTDLLCQPDCSTLAAEFKRFAPQELLNPLFSCLCHPEELVRWHAVTGFGIVVPAMAEQDAEQARVVMRRFLWMLNDESGGIGWGVPEAMAEVMSGSPLLAREYLHMLVSYALDDGPELLQHGNFLEHPVLQEGVLWGLCRIARLYRDILLQQGLAQAIGVYFPSPQGGVRGQVCRLCGLLMLSDYRAEIAMLRTDISVLRVYHEGTLFACTVADLAESALLAITADQTDKTPGGIGTTGSPPRQ